MAVEVFGKESQQQQLIEELAELIVALNHYNRGRIQFGTVIGEMADVYIMLEQLRCIYHISDGWMDNEIKRKLNRLREKLKTPPGGGRGSVSRADQSP